ncbi:MAG: glycosyltransferase [Actinomycetaceae bacterium]|nr:glycosyltransferase [Actinomycetaceae bacterium]MDY5273914.1 glycosyltransferase [Arcanobacterium sp.]
MADQRKELLIVSFSDINADARVLKQVRLFRDTYDVTTASFGQAPEGVSQHIQLPVMDTLRAVNGRYILLHQYRAAYWRIPAIRAAWKALRGKKFDLAIANDLDAVPLVARLKLRYGFHADLHEYYPALHEDDPSWARYRKPWILWLCKHYLPQATSCTTVSGGLQKAYREYCGLDVDIVPNATPYAALLPRAVSEPIKLVHSGACLRNRHLDVTLQAVQESDAPVTIDLYLTPNDPPFLQYLKDTYASERIVFHDPVPYVQLVDTLNRYDVGVHLMIPSNFNNTWALPNKVFDYVQARLGILIGPSPEMMKLVNDAQNGIIAKGFEAQDLVASLKLLTVERVQQLKAASDSVAKELSAENQMGAWVSALDNIASLDRMVSEGL